MVSFARRMCIAKKKMENLCEDISLIIIGKNFARGLRYLFKLRLEFAESTKLRKFLFENFQWEFIKFLLN